MADAVKAKVASGEYATTSDVIYEGLCILIERDRSVERWLWAEVATNYDEFKPDPSKVLTLTQVRGHLAHRRRTPASKQ